MCGLFAQLRWQKGPCSKNLYTLLQGENTMSSKAAKEKKRLKSIIKKMAQNRTQYVKSGKRDFTRNRKLDFETVLSILLTLDGGSSAASLLEYFKFSNKSVSSSAFVQQRNKLKTEAMEYLFHAYIDSMPSIKTFKGYRLLAVDGSDLHIPTDPNDVDSYYPGANGKAHYSLLHLNALYDLENGVYWDALVQKSRLTNENLALTTMIARSNLSENVIVLADRGYECYNNLAHLQQKGWNFLFRIKDGKYGIASGFELPSSDEFDLQLDLNLTRRTTNEVKRLCAEKPNHYRWLPSKVNFDFLPTKWDRNDPITFFNLKFRVVRFKITGSSYETVATNLPADSFSPADIKALYARRWGIETAFRHLKHTIGLEHFYSKKAEYIHQEIFARLTMYNFTKMITSPVTIRQKKRKYTYSVNFSAAAHICRNFFLDNVSPLEVEVLLSRLISPARPGRNFPRKKKE